MRSLAKEPFVHFILFGFVLFVVHGVWQRHVSKADHTIYVSANELARQAKIFASENRRQPTEDDIRALLFAHIEEQALSREAVKLGLDADDVIIRRRLAQKMRFMIEDVDASSLPRNSVLRAWYKKNALKFIVPAKRSFVHIYLSPEKHADALADKAEHLLAEVTDEGWQKLGDPFISSRIFKQATPQEVEKTFGGMFAKSLFTLETTEAWIGPVESSLGLHLVKISEATGEFTPTFEAIRSDVEQVWLDENRIENNRARLRKLIKKYKVEVEDDEKGRL